MTPFDNYLIQNDPFLNIVGTIIVTGLISGVLTTLFYCVAICAFKSEEMRSERTKRLYNHKFNHKRELL